MSCNPLPVTRFDASAFLHSIAREGAGLWLAAGSLRIAFPESMPAARREELATVALAMTAELVDLLERFHERAAVLEHEGGFPRDEAEALAWAEVSR